MILYDLILVCWCQQGKVRLLLVLLAPAGCSTEEVTQSWVCGVLGISSVLRGAALVSNNLKKSHSSWGSKGKASASAGLALFKLFLDSCCRFPRHPS